MLSRGGWTRRIDGHRLAADHRPSRPAWPAPRSSASRPHPCHRHTACACSASAISSGARWRCSFAWPPAARRPMRWSPPSTRRASWWSTATPSRRCSARSTPDAWPTASSSGVSAAPKGALARLRRPIDALSLLRELDAALIQLQGPTAALAPQPAAAPAPAPVAAAVAPIAPLRITPRPPPRPPAASPNVDGLLDSQMAELADASRIAAAPTARRGRQRRFGSLRRAAGRRQRDRAQVPRAEARRAGPALARRHRQRCRARAAGARTTSTTCSSTSSSAPAASSTGWRCAATSSGARKRGRRWWPWCRHTPARPTACAAAWPAAMPTSASRCSRATC